MKQWLQRTFGSLEHPANSPSMQQEQRRDDSDHVSKTSAVGSLIAYQMVGKPVWTPRRYDALTDEGYRRNVIVYRAVNLIARSAASVPWRLYHDGKELTQHPVLDLIHCPNPKQAGSAFIESVLAYLLLSGNSYIEMISHNQHNTPLELYALRPDRVRVIPGKSGVPEAYDYTVNGQTRTLAVNQATGSSKILHLKFFNPLNDWYGLSPLEAASTAIDQHNMVSSHNLALLQNGGRPSGALIVHPKGNQTPLTDEQRQALRDDLRALYQGDKNAGRLMVLEGDFEWQEMGLSPKDLDFISGKSLSTREIAQAYGVPPMLVGVPGDATFSNYKEARYHLWEDTILPLLDQFTDELNLWLCARYQPGLRLVYHIDGIQALAARREEAWAKFTAATFLTINEKRHALGYAPLTDGDHL